METETPKTAPEAPQTEVIPEPTTPQADLPEAEAPKPRSKEVPQLPADALAALSRRVSSLESRPTAKASGGGVGLWTAAFIFAAPFGLFFVARWAYQRWSKSS